MKINFERKKILILFVLLILSLILRELPYINVLVAGKLWIFYGLLFLFLIFPWKISPLNLVLLSLFFLFIAFIFTLGRLYILAEILGLGIYFLLWLAVVLKIVDYLRC